MRIFLSIVLIFLFSCNPHSKDDYKKEFDVSLLQKNEQFRLSGEYDSLVNLNRQYYQKADKIKYRDGKALCYINLAELNISLENYQKSQVLFDKAKEILDDSDNSMHKARFYNVYGRFNMELRRVAKAFEYNGEALEYIRKTEGSEAKNNLLFNIYLRQALYLIHRKQYAQGLDYLQKARKLNDTGLAECAISDYIYMNKNKDSAYKYITIAYQKANERKTEDGIALYANTIMGEYYIADKQYDKAEEVLIHALKIDQKTKRIYAYYSKYIYNDLRKVYERKGDKEKAYFYLQAYSEAISRTNTSLLATINQDMESFMTETKKDSEEHLKYVRWLVLLSVAGLLLLGLYAWSIIRKLRKRKKVLKVEAEHLKNRINDNRQEEIMDLARNNDPEFLNHFRDAYPELINSLLKINPDLENSELAFCAMLKLHFTSKEIAAYTLIQHRTVQQKKYRIRKKLNIPGETDIYDFFDKLS
ncbi:hypothetical protein DRF67_10480 [Chryseobacterium pennipullorum]|uniref:Tetratricopeptide repeat protein n=2 Tax=Chryseobacterium pennipullorum TaxID=2258963 RepID=A0A3D9B1L0_9FLAO|nr:hypothetical protein DRF67_10480 [Chryseobacterium pennipullorum]